MLSAAPAPEALRDQMVRHRRAALLEAGMPPELLCLIDGDLSAPANTIYEPYREDIGWMYDDAVEQRVPLWPVLAVAHRGYWVWHGSLVYMEGRERRHATWEELWELVMHDVEHDLTNGDLDGPYVDQHGELHVDALVLAFVASCGPAVADWVRWVLSPGQGDRPSASPATPSLGSHESPDDGHSLPSSEPSSQGADHGRESTGRTEHVSWLRRGDPSNSAMRQRLERDLCNHLATLGVPEFLLGPFHRGDTAGGVLLAPWFEPSIDWMFHLTMDTPGDFLPVASIERKTRQASGSRTVASGT